RRFDPIQLHLSIEMVDHGDTGPAGRWATRVKAGDRVSIVGPGPVKGLAPEADWFLLAGDMSALPAISVNLVKLPATAVGHAVIEIIHPEDKLAIEKPDGIELTWVVGNQPASSRTRLEEAVKALSWRAGRVAVWIAGEYASARALRQYIRNDRQVPREDMYVSCYWKMGDTDEQMKAAKRADPEGW
ncbi:MAG: siderophore-interacting protein, partial [Myxococcota bacterium]